MRTALLIVAAALLSGLAAPANAQQHRRAPAATHWLDVVARTPEGGYRQGNPDAPIKLVEYGSRTCPTCGRFAAEGIPALREKYIRTGKLSFEYRDLMVHGAPDLALAMLNQCVPTRAFFPVLDAIHAAQRTFLDRLTAAERSGTQILPSPEELTPAAAASFARALDAVNFMEQHGLAHAQAERCLADAKRAAQIVKVSDDAGTVHGAEGTPTFLLNGRRLEAYSWAMLEPELIAAGS